MITKDPISSYSEVHVKTSTVVNQKRSLKFWCLVSKVGFDDS
jgi:hypothetical protein